jgi:hypothetical protein
MRRAITAVLVAAPFVMGAASAAPAEDGARGHEVMRFADPEIVESSGLVVRDGQVVTMNDSGDSARVFTVDLATGRTVGTTRWGGDASDLESLAPAGPGEVWAGDTGDNGRSRKDIEITRLPVGSGDRTVKGETFHLRYPDGPQDAEALVAQPGTGRLFVITKRAMAGEVFAAPTSLDADGSNVLRKVGDAPGLVTDAAFFPDGKHLLVRNYFKATVMTFPALERVAEFDLPEQQQGEGLAIDTDGTVYLSTEGADQPLLRIDLPAAATAALSGTPLPTVSATPSPSPSVTAAPDRGANGSGDDPAGSGGWWVWTLFGGFGVLMLGGLFTALRSR